MNEIISILTNQRLSPYRVGTIDKIQLKLSVFLNSKRKISYLPNIPIKLYLNFDNTWDLVKQNNTNKFGYYIFNYSCFFFQMLIIA